MLSTAAPRRSRRISVPAALALGTLGSVLVACSGDPLPSEVASPLAEAASPVKGDVRFVLDSRHTTPISPLIYGANSYHSDWSGAAPPPNLTLSRHGGNRLSAYNWETNASNAGSDWNYQNDGHMGGGEVPGEAVRSRAQAALDRGAAMIVTVPTLGYVAADKSGPMGTDEATLATRLATRFHESRPRKGSAFSLRPDVNDRYVYQDEYVWWLTQTFPQARASARQPLLFSLDNEPDIWHETHEQVRSRINGKPNHLTYDELVQRTVDYAAAIKDVAPEAVVLGGVTATYSGLATLGRTTPDPVAGRTEFVDYYLDKMRDAERVHGRRLLDVLDVHWYSEVRIGGARVTDDAAPQTPELAEARMQAPRSLWDPTYTERSWVTDVTRSPIRLLPRLKEKIAARYPGTKIAISEYFYGRGGDISGGIAQADALGIFGREGVYAAAFWPAGKKSAYGGDAARAYAYIVGAFRMFRDYDGKRGSFGDTGIRATTTDVERTSVYASVDAGNSDRVVVVAINKSSTPLTAAIELTHSRSPSRAEVYTLTTSSPAPQRQPDLVLPARGAFAYTMPAQSVTTLVLR